MSNIRITKQFSFETGHALYGYDGKCKNIKGHTNMKRTHERKRTCDLRTHVLEHMISEIRSYVRAFYEHTSPRTNFQI